MRTTQRKTLLVALTLLTASTLGAQTNYASGSLAAPWLELSTDTRGTALAATAALPQGIGSLQQNVAGLADLKGWDLEAGHTSWVQSTALEHAGLGWGDGRSGIALGFDYLGLGGVDAYTVNAGQLTAAGSFNPSAYTATLGLAQALGNGFALGLSGKWVEQTLDGSNGASALAGDLGLRWAWEGFNVGLAAQNLGGQLQGANLPGQVKAGLGYRFDLGAYPLTLSADYTNSLEATDGSANVVAAGLQWEIQTLLAVEAGYRSAQTGSLGGTTGLSAGLELRYDGWRVGYAYSGLGDLGAGQQVEIGVGW